MELINSFDSPAFVNHLAAPVATMEREPEDSARGSGLRASRETVKNVAALVFPRDAWIQSWAVAPF